MLKTKKVFAILLTLAMVLSGISPVLASGLYPNQLTTTPISQIAMGAPTTINLKVNGFNKEFTNAGYKINPYREIKFQKNLAAYDKMDFYLGIEAASASATDGVKVNIYKGVLNDAKTGYLKNFSADSVTIMPGENAKKITIDLEECDSVQMNFSKLDAANTDGLAVTAGLGNFNLYSYGYEGVKERHTLYQSYNYVQLDGLKQCIPYSQIYSPNSSTPYYQEIKPNITEGVYSGIEFYLGIDPTTITNTTGDYIQVRVTEQTTNGTASLGIYDTFKLYQGQEAIKVTVPLAKICGRLQFTCERMTAAGVRATAQTTSGELKFVIGKFALLKGTKVSSLYPATVWNATAENIKNSSAFPANINFTGCYGEMYLGQTKITDAPVYVQIMNNGVAASYPGYVLGRSHANRTTMDGSNQVYLVNGQVYDRFQAYVAVPTSDNAVPVRENDYVFITGYNWDPAHMYDVNYKINGKEIYRATAMPNGFCEFIDLDISKYDCLFVKTNLGSYTDPGTSVTSYRHIAFCNYTALQYYNTEINGSYNESTKTVSASSKAVRSAGSLVAASYKPDGTNYTMKGIAINNSATFGSNNGTVYRNGAVASTTIPLISQSSIDCTGISADANFVKLYYTENTLDPALAEQNSLSVLGIDETNLVGTYMLSSTMTAITSVGACNAITVSKGNETAALPLPDYASVYVGDTLYDGIGVTWSSTDYNADSAGTYTFTGTLNSEDLQLRNLKNTTAPLTASVNVTVQPATVKTEESIFSTANFGGGGFVTGIVFHPLDESLAYCRTDVGGAYRYDSDTRSWTCITDFLSNTNLYGIDGIAVDPQNTDVVYMCAGMYWYNAGHCIYKSTDRGETWTDISFTNDSRVFSGNSANRQSGECIAVDPRNSNVIYCGTRNAGLWVSTNGGSSWSQISTASIPVTALATGTNSDTVTGIRNVVFDPASAAIDGKTSVIYAGVFDTDDITGGVYRSSDAGATWSYMTGSPARPLFMKVDNGDVFVSSGNFGEAASTEGFFKYNNATSSWTNLTPSGYAGAGSFDTYYNASNQQVIILGEGNKGAKLYKKVGSGNWTYQIASNVTRDTSAYATWFKDTHSSLLGQYAYLGTIKTRTYNGTKELWILDGGVGVWRNTDVENSNTYVGEVKGIELTWTYAIAAPSSGNNKLFASNADFGMIKTTDTADCTKASQTSTYYDTDDLDGSSYLGYTYMGKNTDISVCEDNTSYVGMTGVKSGNTAGTQMVVLSRDNGANFYDYNYIESDGEMPGNLSISAKLNTNGLPNIVTIPAGDAVIPKYSADYGDSWENVSGLPQNMLITKQERYKIMDSDKVNANVFYAYNPNTGRFYHSMDGGATFTASSDATTLSGCAVDIKNTYIPTVKAKPGTEGEVWVSNSRGLFKSTDYGNTFAKVTNTATIAFVTGFTFGANVPGTNTPAVYVIGSVEGTYGMYRSDDLGASWTKINDYSVAYRIGISDIAGDMNSFGRVYIATTGRGVMAIDTAAYMNVSDSGAAYTANVIYRKASQNMQIFAAAYVDGALYEIKKGSVKTVLGEDTLTVDKIAYSGEKTVVYKVFVWDSISGLKPLFNTVIK